MAIEPAAAAQAIEQSDSTHPEFPSAMAPNYAGPAVPGRSSLGNNELANKNKQQWPRAAPPASSEHIQSYFAQLSDIQQMLSQRATLAAQLGPSAAAAAAKAPPASLAAAVQHLNALDSAMNPAGSPSAPGAAAAEGNGSSRKRRKRDAGRRAGSTAAAAASLAGQVPDDFDTAAAVAGALFSSAAGDMMNSSASRDSAQLTRGSLRQLAAPAWCTVDMPGSCSSSYKGVQYLTAERRWQAYVVDHDITEVVWLGKYDTDWEAAQAHDRELIMRMGSTAAAPFVNFQSSLTKSGSSSSGNGSSGAMSLLPQPPALTVQDIQASTAEAAGAPTTQPCSFSLAGSMSGLQPPTLLPLASLQEPATTTAAAAAAAFGSANFSSSFSMPVLDPPLPLSLAGPASTASGDGFAQYSHMHSDGFALYNSTSSSFPPLAGAERLSVPGVAAAPVQAVNFSASELSAQAAGAPPAAGGPGGPRYRIGRVQVTTAGPAAVAASASLQWPPLMSAEQLGAAGSPLGTGVAAGDGTFAAHTAAQPGSMMALLAPTPPPPVAAVAPARADLQGAGSSGGWMQQQPAAFSTSAAGAMPGLGMPASPLPPLLPLSTAQQGSGGWAAPGGVSQLPAASGHQGSGGSSSSLAVSLPASTVPLGNGGSNNTTAMLPVSPRSVRAEHMPKISTTDVLVAAGGSSTGGCLGLPLSPTAHTAAAKASLPCSPVAAAAAAASPAAIAAAAVSGNPISPVNPESAAAWAASHIAAAEAAVPVSKYKGVEYLPAQQKWQAYVVEPALNEVVFLGTYDTELEAAHAHDREVMQRMGGATAAAPQLNFVQAAAAAADAATTTKAEPQSAAGAQLPPQQQQKLDANSSALAALAEGPAMAAALAAVANDAGHDRASIMNIAQAAAAAAAAAAGAAAAAAASLGDASKVGTRRRGNRSAGAGRGRRGAAAAAGAPKHISQYKGVSWSASCSKWVAVIWDRVQRKARHLGVFEDEEAAAVAYDKEVVATQGAKNTGLNFRERLPTYQEELGIAPQDATTAPEAATAAGGGSAAAGDKGTARRSSYRGISWHDRSKRWEARAWGAGRQHFVGSFLDQEEAARAYDRAILKLGGSGPKSASRLNFPLADYDLSEIEAMEFPVPGTGPTGKAFSTRRPAKRARTIDDYDSEDDTE